MNLSRFPSNIALILIPDTGKTLTGRRLPKYIVNKTPKSDQKTRSRQYFIETWSLLIQGRNPDCDQNGGVRNSKHYYATIVSRTSTTSQGVLFKCNKALFQINRPAIGRANPLVFVAGSRTGQKMVNFVSMKRLQFASQSTKSYMVLPLATRKGRNARYKLQNCFENPSKNKRYESFHQRWSLGPRLGAVAGSIGLRPRRLQASVSSPLYRHLQRPHGIGQ